MSVGTGQSGIALSAASPPTDLDFDELLSPLFRVSCFDSVEDTVPKPRDLTIYDLRDLIARAWCGSEALGEDRIAKLAAGPLIKLTTFSASRGCDTETVLTGIELDVDETTLSPERALTILRAAGIRAIVHTTKRHQLGAPRWRVLAPTSSPLPVGRRRGLVAALAELLGVKGDEASARPAQMMFISSIRGRNRFVELTEGCPIDEVLRPVDGEEEVGEDEADNRPRNWCVDRVASALDAIPPAEDRGTWLAVGAALHHGSEGSEEGLGLWLAWSGRTAYWQGQPRRAEDEVRTTWKRGLRRFRGRVVTLGSLYHLAHEAGWVKPSSFDLNDLDDLEELPGEAVCAPATLVGTDPADRWLLEAFDPDGEPDLSHDQLALDLGRAGWNRDARYCGPLGGWLLWGDQHWEPEPGMRPTAIVRGFLRTKARLLVEWAERRAKTLDPKGAEKLMARVDGQAKMLRQDATIAAVERLARSNVRSIATPDQWDSDDFLLGTPGGTVDLRTGQLRPARRDDYITRTTSVAPAEPGGRPEAWLRFLAEIFPGDPNMPGFMQRLAGYSLTGSTREHRLFLFQGSGRNGKGTLLGALQEILGDYARGIPTSTLLESRSPQHASPLARLRGARFVRGAELPVGQVWNESLVKQLTGGDTVTANLMRQDSFDFVPKFTLIVDGNTRPRIRTTDVAMRSRMTLIPFAETFAGREDRELPERLRAEAPAILRWAIEGAVAWQREGLRIPGSVDRASREYLDSEDGLADFLEDETIAAPGERVPAGAIYARYRGWAQDQGLAPVTQRAFGGMLSERGVERSKSTGGARVFVGLRLRGGSLGGASDPFA